ncbi:tetratricopeptide repeat protein [Leptospira congkakensis]|uniref:Tetratricopeptide repeat protein n=1 Tax=Leptospira congkakensis TaxID=2484932 RepID=A0A4Z1A756_9LEPT|nr:SpoIIE family protein phosphatase [Leptospira congkakensis]TGL86813.1 tetratricopeptide repeat protein [Leptospira congkakensis]TGL93643.1 tetratricopeptide repeat protein [Leptospira congkakensis]TGL94950.1 tetratricopeptide repeat protein [Leptospira congkakensis]
MSESILSVDHILTNYYTFGSLIVTVLLAVLTTFFFTLKDKTVATKHMALACLFLCLFQFGYLLGAFYYHPIASYHRWITGGFIIFGITHFGQFFFRFPDNEDKKAASIMLAILHAIAIVVVLWFLVTVSQGERKYHFTAHHWDFNSEGASRILSLFIAAYSFINFLVLPGYRILHLKKDKRGTLFIMLIAALIAAVVPNITNVMSRDGAMERSTYLTALVLLFTLTFFIITITFINNSSERTTFMVKIVGISFVTILLIMQAFSYLVDQEKETSYDSTAIQKALRVAEGGERSKDILFVIEYDLSSQNLKKAYLPSSVNVDLPLVQADLYNTALYDEVVTISEAEYRNSLRSSLAKTPYYFEGYKNAIIQFLDENPDSEGAELKSEVSKLIEKLNRRTFINTNKLGDILPEQFCEEGVKYVEKVKNVDTFRDAILKHVNDCKWDGKEISGRDLRVEMLKFFRYFKPDLTRHYRKDLDGVSHYIAYMTYDAKKKINREVGFNYRDYRAYMHKSAKLELIILAIVMFVLLIIFPLFFRSALVNPLYALLAGVEKVNQGNLEVEVPIKVNDEIGYLAESFNGMVSSIRDARRELQDYAENLEEKVKERTKELQEKMDEIHRLKVQQDGDYFLTSLLAKPLFFNANKSDNIRCDFFVHQKKTFEFRNKTGDLGGDICITGNLKLGKPDDFRRYTMVMNGDAMGKSMQGAGGSLVMGVVMNSIVARSAGNKRILNRTPEEWLTDVYEEVNAVFKSFSGTMVISATVMLIEDESGKTWYFNAEHPYSILYRDGKASFIEEELKLRKLGLDSEYPFEVQTFQLLPGDQLILGSDGRDDIDLTPDEDVRTINEDETMVLRFVEEADGDIYEIEKLVKKTGDITDDISMLSVIFKSEKSPISHSPEKDDLSQQPVDDFFDTPGDDWDEALTATGAFEEGKILYQNGEIERAITVMKKAFLGDPSNQKLNKFLGLVSYKGKEYDIAAKVLTEFLKENEGSGEYWYYLAMSEKKLGNYESALKAAQEALKYDSENFQNLINLADVSRLLGNVDRAVTYVTRAQSIDPTNKNVLKLSKLLEKATSLN